MKNNIELPHIVGIGASAGGLEAFEKFFSNLPYKGDITYVLVTHLDPSHKSILGELIKKYTKMKVNEIEDGMQAKVNQIYIIPPNFDLTLEGNIFKLSSPSAPRGLRLPIDRFFRSLAETQKEFSIGIILSGTGSDGSLGLRDIKGVGGMIMVGSPETAKYSGMPYSAIRSTLADFVLAPQDMPRHLISYIKNSYNSAKTKLEFPEEQTEDLLNKILINLRTSIGIDFSVYKEKTILRRLEKRMSVNNILTLNDYAKFLSENNTESGRLSQELFIGVTSFFRDKEAFDTLKEYVIPKLFNNENIDSPIRIWIPACSTGEEAYSIGILIADYLDTIKEKFEVQIFATDMMKKLIEKARAGIYPDNVAVDIPENYLKSYFIKQDDKYEIKKEIRNSIVFAVQIVTADPPFSKLDLISCRNLLIYLTPTIQKKLLLLFHYILKSNGFLFLGNSESIGSVSSHFTVIHSFWKIFQKNVIFIPDLEKEKIYPPMSNISRIYMPKIKEGKVKKISFEEIVKNYIVEKFSNSAVLVNKDNNILYFYGRTGKFLEPSEGDAQLNILDMAREGMHLELSTALRKARIQKKGAVYQDIKLKLNNNIISINLRVEPLTVHGFIDDLNLVIFEENPIKTQKKGEYIGKIKSDIVEIEKIKLLEDELESTKKYLQTAIEDLEITNEELKSTNEELQSSNEEFQSTNEELQTSREELQSINEELITVNTELDVKMTELSLINDDLLNLIDSTDVGTIFLDLNLKIKRFTPPVKKILNLIDSDIGRPIHHITSNLNYSTVIDDANNVIKTKVPRNIDLQQNDGKWYNVRILPYKTMAGIIDGVVISFIDITEIKNANYLIEKARDFSENIIKTMREPLLILDSNFKIVSANTSFYETFSISRENANNISIFNLENGQWDIPELRLILEQILPKSLEYENYEITHEFQMVGKKIMLLNARRIINDKDETDLILLVFEDITSFRKSEEMLKTSEEKYRNEYNLANFYKDLFAHDMSNILQSIISTLEFYDTYQNISQNPQKIGELVPTLKKLVFKGSTLISSVRKLSKIKESDSSLKSVNINDPLKKSTQSIRKSNPLRKIIINVIDLTPNLYVQGDDLLIDIFDNILNNSVNYSNEERELEISIKITELEDQLIQLEFIDNGIGIPDDRKKELFDQHKNDDVHSRGMGMGLSLVKKIVEKYQGKISVEDKIKGKSQLGTNFKIILRKSL